MLGRLSVMLRDQRLLGVDPDSAGFLKLHREILDSKPMMRDVFAEIYRGMREADQKYFSGNGSRVEVGAGVSFMKSMYPDIISTDIKAAPHLDQVMDALNMPVPDKSVRALYGINCFHHFPDVIQFFKEMDRVLVPGGGVLIVDPYYGWASSIIYKVLFSTETFDKEQVDWKSQPSVTGVMTGANQALSYIVFKRDRAKFQELFPQFEIVEHRRFHNYSRYLLSGGLNFHQLVPNWFVPILKGVETLLAPIDSLFALHHMVVIRKKS